MMMDDLMNLVSGPSRYGNAGAFLVSIEADDQTWINRAKVIANLQLVRQFLERLCPRSSMELERHGPNVDVAGSNPVEGTTTTPR